MRIASERTTAFKVVIVDRDSMSSDLLASALVRDRSFEASAVPSAQLMSVLSQKNVDLVVIGAELNWNSGSGFELARAVGVACSGVSVVILLNQSTSEAVINAFRSGAKGVFSREQPMSQFLECIEHVRKGLIWAGPNETVALLEAFKSIPAPTLKIAEEGMTLTSRELQVVQYAAKGLTNRAIASELNLSEHTVKNYLFRAFEKLGVSSRVELLFYLTIQGHTFTGSGFGQLPPGREPKILASSERVRQAR